LVGEYHYHKFTHSFLYLWLQKILGLFGDAQSRNQKEKIFFHQKLAYGFGTQLLYLGHYLIWELSDAHASAKLFQQVSSTYPVCSFPTLQLFSEDFQSLLVSLNSILLIEVVVSVDEDVRPQVSSFLSEVAVISTVLGLVYYVVDWVVEGYYDVLLHKVDKSWEDLL
jgi:hypothetical protein